MLISLLKSKIHAAVITQANIHYKGSITIDKTLMEAANLVEFEMVQVLNINNGERIETYVIEGERNSGIICLNGAAARKAVVGDTIIIVSMHDDSERAKDFSPTIVFPQNNHL